MFVCLWSPVWRTVADSLAELSPALLTVAPRVVTEERRGGLVWVDARGLDAEHIAHSALEVLRGIGLSNVRVGIGRVPIVAEIIAWGLGTGDWGLGRERSVGVEASAAVDASRPSLQSPSPQSPVSSPQSLGSLPVSVLEPDPALATLLDGIGVETCGELAALEGESVEVRLGAEGVRLWKLARGEDDRLIFTPMPRELPHASLEWSDYTLTDTERLVFSVNALLGTVCEKLMERGSLSREMTLDLALANGATLTNAVRSGRATASRKTWLRLVRTLLERMVLPAGVVGLTLRAATVVTDVGQQGDLFDRGFATAAATEAALASLAEEQGEVVVVPENTAHPLVERRTKWIGNRESGIGNRESKRRPGRKAKASGTGANEKPNERPILVPDSLPSSPNLVSDSRFPIPDSRLTLYLLPTPRAIEARTEERRDHVLPTGYRDGGAWYGILSAAGPDRVSGERWGEAYAREYFRCIVDDGGMVWLYHDARADGWYLHGWWD
jgi:impB/mucB/samB family protein